VGTAPAGEGLRGPLRGIRVLELGQLIAAPVATRLLAEFGAEVIKVEPPAGGDPLRAWGETADGVPLWWKVQARNKRLVTADLRRPEGRSLVLRLVPHCDVLVENFRPGRLAAWGMDDATLRELRPDLVIVHISGYGQSGPYRDRPGFGNVAESMGGLRYVTGEPDGPPLRTGVSLGDEVAALHAVIGALLGLLGRERDGAGETVDVALTEAVFSLLESMIPEYRHLGRVRERTGNRLLNAAPSGVYRSRDGRWLAIGGNGDSIFARLCQVLGHPELPSDERFRDNRGRVRHAAELDALIGAWVGERDADEVLERLTAAGVPAGPVYSVADIAADPQFAAREMILGVPDPDLGVVWMPGIAPKLARQPGAVAWAGGGLGADNEAVYGGLLGLSAEELRQLAERGVI
jgi:crotonobetainyl-CoA:carnitine CoA-transferase CaiB-like acyl-CoA transferase